jgi:hypothetical protein
MFDACSGPAGGPHRPLCLAELGASRALPCLEPGDDITSFLLPDGPVLVIDAEERGRLAQLLGVRFRPVERRQTRLGRAARLRQAWRAVVDGTSQGLSRLRHPLHGAVLPESALSAAERTFLRELRAAQAADAAPLVLTDSAAPPRLTPDGWRLGRAHADVRAAVRAVAADPSRAYVAMLVLCDDAAPHPRSRAGWRETMAR